MTERTHYVTKKTVASKYRQGREWIVSSYSPGYDAWAESHAMSYYSACNAVKNARESWDTRKQAYVY